MDLTELMPMAFSIKDAGATLSLGKTTIFNLIREGRLRVVRVGGRTLIPADSLRALLEKDSE